MIVKEAIRSPFPNAQVNITLEMEISLEQLKCSLNLLTNLFLSPLLYKGGPCSLPQSFHAPGHKRKCNISVRRNAYRMTKQS